jgi:hypothetical protein
MDINQILQARANRATRHARPFSNFHEMYLQCVSAGEMLVQGSIDPKFQTLLERSAVISLVTSVETYYRDILEFIFKYCEPTFFEPHLKNLLPEKLDITDLIDVYRKQIHPLELVVSSQSFQNVDRIDRVFSRFLKGRGLWESILQLRVHIKDDPGTEASFSTEMLFALKKIFNLRHELVHNPAQRCFFDEATLADLHGVACMVFGSDIVLLPEIQANRDPVLDEEQGT